MLYTLVKKWPSTPWAHTDTHQNVHGRNREQSGGETT